MHQWNRTLEPSLIAAIVSIFFSECLHKQSYPAFIGDKMRYKMVQTRLRRYISIYIIICKMNRLFSTALQTMGTCLQLMHRNLSCCRIVVNWLRQLSLLMTRAINSTEIVCLIAKTNSRRKYLYRANQSKSGPIEFHCNIENPLPKSIQLRFWCVVLKISTASLKWSYEDGRLYSGVD